MRALSPNHSSEQSRNAHLASKSPDIYTAEEVHFLSVVAEQIALAFDNALHFDAAQASQQQLLRKNERLELLLELTNHVVSNLELRDLLRAVVASTRRIMGCDVRQRHTDSLARAGPSSPDVPMRVG